MADSNSHNPRLDRALDAARSLALRDDHRDAAVAALLNVRPAKPPRRSYWLPIAALSWATTALVLILVPSRPVPPTPAPPPSPISPRASVSPPTTVPETVVQIGPRVMLHPHPGATYRVVHATDDLTRIEVASGAVGFRLFHGEKPHRLLVSGGDTMTEAVGTIFTVCVQDGHASVSVQEGKVSVRDGRHFFLEADGSHDPTLEEITASALAEVSNDQPKTIATAPVVTPIADAPPTESATDLWRKARLFRAQGQFRDALVPLEALITRNDSTWSPLALVERARLCLTELHDPAAALADLDAFRDRYASHALRPEVNSLRCDALTQLGQAVPHDCRP